jgi:hypothetical protein
LKLSVDLAILEEGENSAESLPGTKLAVAENEKLAKSDQPDLPELFPVGTGKPTSNCRRVIGTQGGRFGPASQKWGLRGAFKLSTFLMVGLAFEIEIGTVANQNCRSGRMVLPAAMYTSLIYSAVKATQYCGCI